ncbi:hypothetical protein [Aquimarina brevivitae]|uniref:Uncharacterized protein n=1 Tax=Aquimarina brevivitae TaxID=323412 RepID=A0A4Q7NYG4_9FLAO|nr:hypothetical protein [Aquimarina brevivitae]RZS92008.1 hypothetical protein EV197_3117 [Aquimarina brevivitae]
MLLPVLTLLGLILFYKFMTYDRNYTWSKEYYFEVQKVMTGLDFEIGEPIKIDPNSIQLSTEKLIKLKIQKVLNRVNLMNYGSEHGEKIILNSTTSEQEIIFKGRCLSDHLIGIEIEYKNLDPSSLANIKRLFKKQFSNYEIIWNEIQ